MIEIAVEYNDAIISRRQLNLTMWEDHVRWLYLSDGPSRKRTVRMTAHKLFTFVMPRYGF